MADHHMGGASQGGQGPKNNILQQILDKIQEQSLEITALKRAQNTPADQILDKIQEQSIKIAALEQAQRTPELTRNPSPNPAIRVGPEGPADPQDLPNLPRKRKPLPDPEKFTGDRRDFKQWYFEMSHKLNTDRDALGPLKTQFNYVYSWLRGAAQNMVILFSKKAAQMGQYNPDGLPNYLKEYYTDPNTSQRALERLRRIRQGENKPFTAFLP